MQILGRRLIIFFFFNPINPIEMNISLKLFLASLPILFLPVGLQAQLDEQVPYQGDTLLTNPTQRREDGNGRVFMDCDRQIMASMIRDLEERIAGEVETDTLYGDYRTKELEGDRLFMRYECVILRCGEIEHGFIDHDFERDTNCRHLQQLFDILLVENLSNFSG